MRAFAFKSRLNQSEKEKSVQGLDGSVQGLDRFLVMLVLPYTFAQKKQTSMSKKEVVISNSRLNSYGFRVLTEGIDLTQYKRNPILLWMHNRPWRGTKDEVMPLGTVENLRIEGDNLIGTPVFDEKDEFAMKVKAKWDAGIYRMVSAGLDVIEHSNDPSVLLPGQTRSTITKSKLREVSIVDLGANDDALQLYFQGEVVNLSQNEQELSFLKPVNNHLNSKEKMKKIALKLGLAENATEAEVLDAISAVVLKASKADSLQKEVDQLKEASITLAVDSAISAGKITAANRDHFVELGRKAGVESLNATFNCMGGIVKPSTLLSQGANGGGAYEKLSDVPEAELQKLYDSNREEYKRLYKAEYGVNPE